MSRNINEVAPAEHMGCLGGVVRIIWMMVGNGALLFLAVLITEKATFSGLDVAFWAIVAALIQLRFIDITRFHGLTADGEPATLKHWRRYVGLLLLIAGGVWMSAHGIARFLAR